MPATHSNQIKVDGEFLTQVQNHLLNIRSDISAVRGGSNPHDQSHPRGYTLTNVLLQPGAQTFQPGQDAKARITAVGGQIDQRLTNLDGALDRLAQALVRIAETSKHVELNNIPAAKITPYFTGTTPQATPPAATP